MFEWIQGIGNLTATPCRKCMVKTESSTKNGVVYCIKCLNVKGVTSGD